MIYNENETLGAKVIVRKAIAPRRVLVTAAC
jgi:hypothetical protein